MADLSAALATQLHNIQAKTGRTIAALHDELAATGLAKVGEKRNWLMATHKLGYGDANTVALLAGKVPSGLHDGEVAAATAGSSDPLDALYAGPKVQLRAVHEALLKAVRAFGDFEEAPKKTYISLRRKKQFAMVGPATKDQVEVGLNTRDLPPHPRLKVQPPGSMCQATTRIRSAKEVDALLVSWLKRAYDAAG